VGDPNFRRSAQQAALPALGATARRRWRRANRALWLAVVVMVGGSAVSALIVVRERQLAPPVYVTAHRGSSLRAPENSLSAIEAAIEDGADYAEIDVQETANGVIVVMHDSDLLRVAGRNWKIWETDYEQLRDLDAGSWFAPEFAGERIPTLEEVIERARGRIRLNIELKYNGHDQRLAERVVEILEASAFVDHVVISSLELRGIREIRELDPDLRVGFIVASSIGNLTRIDADFFSMNSRSVSQDMVRRLRRNGKGVHVWTVNGRRNMSTFIDLGVENIITDEPAVLREMLREREELDEAEKVLLAFRNWLRS
jgi:glycerophosphoryl diester phosphodiesterase